MASRTKKTEVNVKRKALPKKEHSTASAKKKVVEETTTELLAFQYAEKQLDKIATRVAASINLQGLRDHHEKLIALDYTRDQLAKMAANTGGSHNLQALLDHHKELLALNYAWDQLVRIVTNNGGSNNLQALLNYHEKLLALGYTRDQLAKVATNHCASSTFRLLSDWHELLTGENFGYTTDQLIIIVDHNGAQQTLAAIKAHHAQLRSLKFTHDQIAQLCSGNGSAKTVAFIVAGYPDLEKFHLNNQDITTMSSGNSASYRIAAYLCAYPLLPEKCNLLAGFKDLFFHHLKRGGEVLRTNIGAFFEKNKIKFNAGKLAADIAAKQAQLSVSSQAVQLARELKESSKKISPKIASKVPAAGKARVAAKSKKVSVDNQVPDGYVIKNVPGDGNCFYHAVIDQCRLNGIAHPFLLADDPVVTLRQTLNEPTQARVWASQRTIMAYAQTFGMIAVLHLETEGKPLVYHYATGSRDYAHTNNFSEVPAQCHQGRRPVTVVFNGNHFDSVISCPPQVEQAFPVAPATTETRSRKRTERPEVDLQQKRPQPSARVQQGLFAPPKKKPEAQHELVVAPSGRVGKRA